VLILCFFQTDVDDELSDETTEHLLLEPGNVMKLRCDPSTRPGMAVNWYKEGVRVLATPRIQIRGAVVEITDVTYEDSGVYVCVLRGSKEPVRNFTITVAGEDRLCSPPDVLVHYITCRLADAFIQSDLQ